MGFDPPADVDEPHDLGVGQHRLVLPLEIDGLLLRATSRRGEDGALLGGDRPGDHCAVAHAVDVGVHQT